MSDYEPQSPPSKLYQSFVQTLKTSPYLGEVRTWLAGIQEDELVPATTDLPLVEIATEPDSSGWVTEGQHVATMGLSVAVTVSGLDGLAAMDLAYKVVQTIYPGDDTEQRATIDRLKQVVPVEITLARAPTSFVHDPGNNTTTCFVLFKFDIYLSTTGQI